MLLTVAGTQIASAQPQPTTLEPEWIPGQIIVRADGPEFIDAMWREIESLKLGLIHRSRTGERVTLSVPVGHEQEIAEFLNRAEWARWAIQDFGSRGGLEFDPPPSEMPAPTVSNPHPHKLWFLENTGQTITDYQSVTRVGTPGADIDILGAWERCQGDPSILVAVVDSGIDYTHPDFVGRIYEHDLNYQCDAPVTVPPDPPAECPNQLNTNNCCTSSGCAYGDAKDNHGHGTAVASVLAANANNGVPGTLDGRQFSGVDPQCTLVSVRVSYFNAVGFGATLSAFEDLFYDPRFEAVKVINFSLNGFTCPNPNGSAQHWEVMQEFRSMIGAHVAAGRTIVTISGNSPDPTNRCPNIWPEVITVGATTNTDELWPGGFFDGLDYVAPGWAMYTALWNHPCTGQPFFTTQWGNGTSAAAPIVSGIASLLYARGAKLGIAVNSSIVYECLKQSAEAVNSTLTPAATYQGWGRVNAHGALLKLEELYYDCPADLTHGNTPGEWGYGVPDGVVNAEDLLYFAHFWGLGNVAIADIGSCGDCAEPDCATQDGTVDDSDYALFLCRWAAGCQ